MKCIEENWNDCIKENLDDCIRTNCIVMNHLEKSFNEKTVLKDISINIEEGEIFGLLGPSGAGKTTLIKILTGQLYADKGTADLFGKECSKLTKRDYAKIGMVLDNSGIYERLSCYDNLKIFAILYGLHPDKINDALNK
jgi:ABC-2 type transport system ATP-binding protein